MREMPKWLQSTLRADRGVSGRDGAETDNRDLGETEFEKGKSRTAMRVNPFRERDARAQNHDAGSSHCTARSGGTGQA